MHLNVNIKCVAVGMQSESSLDAVVATFDAERCRCSTMTTALQLPPNWYFALANAIGMLFVWLLHLSWSLVAMDCDYIQLLSVACVKTIVKWTTRRSLDLVRPYTYVLKFTRLYVLSKLNVISFSLCLKLYCVLFCVLLNYYIYKTLTHLVTSIKFLHLSTSTNSNNVLWKILLPLL